MKSLINDLGLMEDSILEITKKKRYVEYRNKNYDSQYDKDVDLLNFYVRRTNMILEKKVRQGEHNEK